MASIDKINVGGAEYGIKTTNPGYLECSTARSTAAKVVAATDFTLDVGAMIAVRFTDTGSSNPSSGNLTLNVGGTGAKTIVDGHTNKSVVTYSSGAWFYNNIVNEFIYDGTYWVWLNRDNNTTYSGGSLYTSASKTGSGTTVAKTIASGTSMDNAIGTLLNNDAALSNIQYYPLTSHALIAQDYIALHDFGSNSIQVCGKMAIMNIAFTVQANPGGNAFVTITNPTLLPKYKTNVQLAIDSGGEFAWLDTDGTIKGFFTVGSKYSASFAYILA